MSCWEERFSNSIRSVTRTTIIRLSTHYSKIKSPKAYFHSILTHLSHLSITKLTVWALRGIESDQHVHKNEEEVDMNENKNVKRLCGKNE